MADVPIEGSDNIEAHIERIRAFSRMYMHSIGVLEERIFDSPYSLAEVRILNELCFRDSLTASVLVRDLAMDSGYVSRILRRFERAGLIARTCAASDRRQRMIVMTEKGADVGRRVLQAAKLRVQKMLSHVADADVARMVQAMRTIDEIINPGDPRV